MSGDLDREISEYAASALLRYFRRGAQVDVKQPRIDAERDRELLRAHWALSAPVRALAEYVLLHRHETQSLLISRRRVDDAVARGRIDALATTLHRLRTGTATSIVAYEPIRTFDTGPNQVLAWVVHNAALFAARFQTLQTPESAYSLLAENLANQINQIRRLDFLREALRSPAIQRRPTPGTLRDATRSRRIVYRLAVEAYNTLIGIEAGHEDAIRTVINSTLVGPLEPWRCFEIAVAMSIGEALEAILKSPLHLSLLAGDTALPILTCGPLVLYWQQATNLYQTPAMEPSEAIVKDILSNYEIGTGASRPDLLLVDASSARVVAIIEVKYLAGDNAPVRFREAVEQIVRYGRGYASGKDLFSLLGRSLVAMSAGAPDLIQPPTEGVPRAIDFSGIKKDGLHSWVGLVH